MSHALRRRGRFAAVLSAFAAIAATTTSSFAVTPTPSATPTASPSPSSTAAPTPAPEIKLGKVSHLASSRITESSGIAASYRYPGLGYTLNDNSEDRPTVYSFRISTGEVLGKTELPYKKRGNTESIYADPKGRLWVGDLGDNDNERTDAGIIRFTEPGPANRTPTGVVRFPVRYSNGKPNVEAMLVNPVNDQVYLINKSESRPATLYRLPATLVANRTNLAKPAATSLPPNVSDGVISRDGRTVILRTDKNIQFFRAPTWDRYAVFDVPVLKNPESVTIEPGQTTFLFGSEGKKSPVYRYPLPS
jgi:hypothetical protein